MSGLKDLGKGLSLGIATTLTGKGISNYFNNKKEVLIKTDE